MLQAYGLKGNKYRGAYFIQLKTAISHAVSGSPFVAKCFVPLCLREQCITSQFHT